MSAALALVARPWPKCRLSYVGGALRDRNNVGAVLSGQEQVVHEENPWDSLGYQVIEDAKEAFDRNSFKEGAQQLRDALRRVSVADSRKSELNALRCLWKHMISGAIRSIRRLLINSMGARRI